MRSLSLSAGLATARHQESFGLRIDTLRGTGTYWAGGPGLLDAGGVATGRPA
ncbi:hypothetical protein [Hymenobacter volaticus]|uniref:Uncharacterized protein n=1 Tax=Hymenobacter volaticus TaxID=2932254 RepID=A0ABY4GED6_9BACT|nr:hypothetical protein [Hymenobacter volaticus]UOQ69291.1 hypothetical protein MUN86_27965 [Hymenobacter volaticus]